MTPSYFKNPWPLAEDLQLFLTVLHKHRFLKAAQELGVSPAYVSKRIKLLEQTLDIKIFHRNTRQLSLTEEGANIKQWAIQILDNMNELMAQTRLAKADIAGNMYICTGFGFGINHVSQAVSELANKHPELNIRLHLTDQEVDLTSWGFHLEIKVGNSINGQNHVKQLAANQRILCASPTYTQGAYLKPLKRWFTTTVYLSKKKIPHLVSGSLNTKANVTMFMLKAFLPPIAAPSPCSGA